MTFKQVIENLPGSPGGQRGIQENGKFMEVSGNSEVTLPSSHPDWCS